MRYFIDLVENLLRDPNEAKIKFNIFTTEAEKADLESLLRRKSIPFSVTPAVSKVAKITYTVEGSHYLYSDIERGIKMAGLAATTLSSFTAPRDGDTLEEGEDAKPWDSLRGFNGDAKECTCSDYQLNNVGCDCDAEQNLPVTCKKCGEYLRRREDVEAGCHKSCCDK